MTCSFTKDLVFKSKDIYFAERPKKHYKAFCRKSILKRHLWKIGKVVQCAPPPFSQAVPLSYFSYRERERKKSLGLETLVSSNEKTKKSPKLNSKPVQRTKFCALVSKYICYILHKKNMRICRVFH